jgi:drug/metabolite transporter (DMT)-like permease
MTPRTATLIGLTAILMWSLLAVLTVATGKIPAFQLAAMTFAIGAAVAFASWIRRRDAFNALRQSALAWIVGVGGLFGYHALYFLALRFAPPAEAGLLNYLWPLLIVLFSSLLPGERLAPHHIIGALLGLAGTVLLLAGNIGSGFAPGQIPGLIAAFVAAFVWAAYSVMSRRLKSVPTDAVAGFCLATALLATLVHGMVEVTVWPETTAQWLAIIALGVGPVGAAFYAWDVGMKRGDIRVLGAASYATPLLSTVFLDSGGLCAAECEHRHRRGADRRRRLDRREGYVLEVLKRFYPPSFRGARSPNPGLREVAHPGMMAFRLVRWRPSLRRQLKFCKLESRCNGAADQRPVAAALGSLPGLRRHHCLRYLARGEIGP